MNYSGDMMKTQKRLIEWGKWCYSLITSGMGYSHQSLITQLQEVDAISIEDAKLFSEFNEKAEEMNTLIEHLAKKKPVGCGKPEWAKIIRIHYTMQSKNISERIQYTALKKATYYRYLNNAQEWISQQLM